MIVIYHDVGGAHSSAIAANIHINNLSMDRIPSRDEILNLPTFDKLEKKDTGHLVYIGEDEFGAKVYTLSRKYKPNLVIPAISDMYKLLNGSLQGFFLADTSPSVNNLMRIGGFSSRGLGLVDFGRPIVTRGTLKAYPQIVDIVRKAKDQMKRMLNK